jgi:site-specific DNA-adenine methylase
MKNHFYISYHGNKREEVENIYNLLDFNDITTIVEPFCGSCAMSYYISTKHPKKFKYILNDNNSNLKEMFDIIRDDKKTKEFEEEFNNIVPSFKDNKEKYNEIVKQNTLISWFIKNKICAIRAGLFPLKDRKYKETLDLSSFPVYNFFKNEDIEFTTQCGIDCFEKYSINKECIILIDPPYIQSCNAFYTDAKINIYEYIYDNITSIYPSNVLTRYTFLEHVCLIIL